MTMVAVLFAEPNPPLLLSDFASTHLGIPTEEDEIKGIYPSHEAGGCYRRAV